MRPITLRNPNLNKGPSSSEEFNKLRNDIQTDITTLFDIVNDHDGVISETWIISYVKITSCKTV